MWHTYRFLDGHGAINLKLQGKRKRLFSEALKLLRAGVHFGEFYKYLSLNMNGADNDLRAVLLDMQAKLREKLPPREKEILANAERMAAEGRRQALQNYIYSYDSPAYHTRIPQELHLVLKDMVSALG